MSRPPASQKAVLVPGKNRSHDYGDDLAPSGKLRLVIDLLDLAVLRRMVADGTARRIRESAGLSVREVAAAVGVAPSCVSRWERGERVPRHGAAAGRYAEALVALAGRPGR